MSENLAQNSFNLDAFGLLDEIEVEIMHPADPDKPLGITVRLAGTAHPVYQEYAEETFRKLQKKLEEVDKLKAEGKEAPREDRTLAEMREENVKNIAARCLSANMPIVYKGKPVELNPETALAILSDPHYIWLARQLIEKCEKHENFMPGSRAKS